MGGAGEFPAFGVSGSMSMSQRFRMDGSFSNFSIKGTIIIRERAASSVQNIGFIYPYPSFIGV